MEIDPEVLSEVLDGVSEFWENPQFLDEQITECQKKITDLEAHRTELNANLESVRSLWTSLKPQSQKVESLSLELDRMKADLSKTDPEIVRFFEENAGSLKVFTDKCIIDRVLKLSSIAIDDNSNEDFEQLAEECQQTGFIHVTERMQKRCDRAAMNRKKELYSDVEKKLQSFAVTSQKSLKAIFLANSGPGAAKASEFRNLIDVVRDQDPKNWQQNLCHVTNKVFSGHLIYHCNASNVDSVVSYVSLVIGLLRVSLQSIYLIMSYPEKHALNFSFYDELSNSLMDVTINEVLTKNNGSLDFYRMLIEQAAALDDWISSVELSSTKSLTDRVFESVGDEWIRVETETMKSLCQAALADHKDFSLAICGSLSSLGNVASSSLSLDHRDRFVTHCVIPSERNAKTLLCKFAERPEITIAQSCWTINCLDLLATQLTEMHELYDGMYGDLYDDSKEAREKCIALCGKIGQSIFSTFERSSANYLLSQSIPWRNGSPTPSLSSALAAVSPQLDIVKENLEATVYTNHFITVLGKAVDSKVYYMLVKRFSWSQPKAIDQFVIDLNAMISVFGGDELRLLRSARVILTQKEEKLNYELPEEDVEHFIISKSSL